MKNKTSFKLLAITIITLLMAGVIHPFTIKGAPPESRAVSGQIVKAKQFSQWKESYEEAVYKTECYHTTETKVNSKGQSVTRNVKKSRKTFSHWKSRTRNHSAKWVFYSSINTSYKVSKKEFEKCAKNFGDRHSVPGDRTTSEHKSRMISGDPNDYESYNKTGYISPVTNHN